MKKSILNFIRYLRYFVILLVLTVFTAVFSGFILHNQQIIQVAEAQFMPAVLTAVGLGGMTAVGVMIFFAAVTAFFGRFYCSWCCPLGLLQEVVDRWFFRKKERQYRPGHPVFRAAFFAFVLISMFCGVSLFIGYVEPYSLFGKISSSIVRHFLSWLNVGWVAVQRTSVVSKSSGNALSAATQGDNSRGGSVCASSKTTTERSSRQSFRQRDPCAE